MHAMHARVFVVHICEPQSGWLGFLVKASADGSDSFLFFTPIKTVEVFFRKKTNAVIL